MHDSDAQQGLSPLRNPLWPGYNAVTALSAWPAAARAHAGATCASHTVVLTHAHRARARQARARPSHSPPHATSQPATSVVHTRILILAVPAAARALDQYAVHMYGMHVNLESDVVASRACTFFDGCVTSGCAQIWYSARAKIMHAEPRNCHTMNSIS